MTLFDMIAKTLARHNTPSVVTLGSDNIDDGYENLLGGIRVASHIVDEVTDWIDTNVSSDIEDIADLVKDVPTAVTNVGTILTKVTDVPTAVSNISTILTKVTDVPTAVSNIATILSDVAALPLIATIKTGITEELNARMLDDSFLTGFDTLVRALIEALLESDAWDILGPKLLNWGFNGASGAVQDPLLNSSLRRSLAYMIAAMKSSSLDYLKFELLKEGDDGE